MDFIATRHPSIKVIAVSGHNDFEYVRTMLTKGCMDYLLKPLESATLISTVGKAVQSWKDEHETNLRHRHLQEKVHSLSAFYSGVLLYKMLDSRCVETAYEELLQADASFSSVDTSYITIPATFQCGMQDLPVFLRILNRRYAATSGDSTVLSYPIRITLEKSCSFCWEPET